VADETRKSLIHEVGLEIRMQQNAVDEVDEAAAEYLGVNLTDERCMDILERRAALTAGELAAETGLTSGAITAVLDRLERVGYVRRLRDDSDRRRVRVEITDEARRLIWDVYGPIAREGGVVLEACTDEQLIFLRDFLRAGRRSLSDHAQRVRAMAKGTSARRRPRGRVPAPRGDVPDRMSAPVPPAGGWT
jgi:DNA-binding MarR family transcriptional regulator